MDTIYYLSSALVTFVFLTLLTTVIVVLVKPHLLNDRPFIKKPMSRPKILLVGSIVCIFVLFGFGTVMAATEPESVRLEREARERQIEQMSTIKEGSQDEAGAAQELVVKIETQTESIPFETIEYEDGTLSDGEVRIETGGRDGVRIITYEVTYVEEKEIERKRVNSEVTEQSIAKIVKKGTYIAPVPQPASSSPPAESNYVYFKNCTAARAAGAAPVYRGEPGYGRHLDRDNDGVGCE